MKTVHHFIGVFVLGAVASGSAAAQQGSETISARLQQYEARAARGDAAAAEQAALMRYHGSTAHGAPVQRDLRRIVVHLQQASTQNRAAARLLLDHMTEEARTDDPRAYVPWPWGC